MLASGGDIDHENWLGASALLVTFESGYVDIVNVLLAAGANINHENHFFGDTH